MVPQAEAPPGMRAARVLPPGTLPNTPAAQAAQAAQAARALRELRAARAVRAHTAATRAARPVSAHPDRCSYSGREDLVLSQLLLHELAIAAILYARPAVRPFGHAIVGRAPSIIIDAWDDPQLNGLVEIRCRHHKGEKNDVRARIEEDSQPVELARLRLAHCPDDPNNAASEVHRAKEWHAEER